MDEIIITSDAAPREKMPRETLIGISLVTLPLLAAVIYCLYLVRTYGITSAAKENFPFCVAMLLAFVGFFTFALCRASRLARWASVVFFILLFSPTFVMLKSHVPGFHLRHLVTLIIFISNLAGLYFLFSRVSSEWFAPRPRIKRVMGPMPKEVATAITLLWVQLGVNIPFLLSTLPRLLDENKLVLWVVTSLVGISIQLVMTLKMRAGRNWARTIFFIFLILSAMEVFSLRPESWLTISLYGVEEILDFAIAYFLLKEVSARWFKPRIGT